jgi:epoxyqueuosine reductase
LPSSFGAPERAVLARQVKQEAARLGFDAVGITRLVASDHTAFYRAWLDAGRHGEMSYLARADAVERRSDPAAAWPELRTAVVVALNYSQDDRSASEDAGRGVVARYARGRDYHKVLRARLLALLRRIEENVGRPLLAARAYVDTGPLLERELARRAGLGWFGRNTMLIHPRRGSYFFLGCLLLELELEEDAPFEADHCGRCTACLDACPTGALLGRDDDGAPIMDATRCISYLTIEHRGPIPRDLRPRIGNRIFGCDICQEVCPWNGPKLIALTREKVFLARQPEAATPGTNAPTLIELMRMDEAAWDRFSRGSAIRRARRSGFLRNVAIALGNWGSLEAVPVLSAALGDSDALVRGHVAWALGRIGSPEAIATLRARAETERDSFVREEIAASLAGR